MRTLPCLLLLLSGSALARGYEGYVRVPICLDAHAPCPADRPDLVLMEHRLEAAGGLRFEGDGEVHTTLAVRLDEPYVVTSHRGHAWRVWVRPPRSALLRVDVEPADQGSRRLTGHFATASVEVEGVSSAGSFGVLDLRDDGRYRLNSGSGHYWLRDGVVHFDGAIAHWGAASVSVDEATLTFEFERATVRWTIRFERSADAPRAVPIAAR